MFYRRCAVFCIFTFVLGLFILSVYAHWVNDPGPTVIDGGQLTGANGVGKNHWWTSYELSESKKSSTGLGAVAASVYQKKEVYDGGFAPKTKGESSCSVFSAATISGAVAKGSYDAHAKARGWLWWRGDRKRKKQFTGPVNETATRGARRYAIDVNPTTSGVHLWGRAKINNQAGTVNLCFEWH